MLRGPAAFFASVLGLLSLLGLCSCNRASEHRLLVVGSTSVQPFAEKLAHHFGAIHPEIRVDVQGGGSSAGIRVVSDRACDIGTSSRNLKEEERNELKQFMIARDGIAVIVHRDNPVNNITPEQVRGIFAGKITDWTELGGRPGPIYAISREDGSGTFGAFRELAMEGEQTAPELLVFNTNGAVRETVSKGRSFIGYISLGLVNAQVKALKINGVAPSNESIQSRRYPYVRPFLFLTKGEPQGDCKSFIDYVLSPQGQKLLEREGLCRAQ